MNQFLTEVSTKKFIQSVENKLKELEFCYLYSRECEINKRLKSFANRFLLIRNKQQITSLVDDEVNQAAQGGNVSTAIRHISNFKTRYKRPYLELKHNLWVAIDSNKASVLVTSNELNFIKMYANGSAHMHILSRVHNINNTDTL